MRATFFPYSQKPTLTHTCTPAVSPTQSYALFCTCSFNKAVQICTLESPGKSRDVHFGIELLNVRRQLLASNSMWISLEVCPTTRLE
jgi:hypothetical protein